MTKIERVLKELTELQDFYRNIQRDKRGKKDRLDDRHIDRTEPSAIDTSGPRSGDRSPED